MKLAREIQRVKKLAAGVLMAVMSVTAVATTAQANVIAASRAGTYAFTDTAQSRIYSKDTVCDSHFVRADWRTTDGSGGSLTNKNGCGHTKSARVAYSPVKIKQVRACRSNTATPMSCSAWSS